MQVKKDGLLYSKVTVYASGNNIEFRFAHAEAQQFGQALQSLILGGASSANAAPAPPVSQAPDLLQQLRQLGELHDGGVLTDEEFQAKKSELLGRL